MKYIVASLALVVLVSLLEPRREGGEGGEVAFKRPKSNRYALGGLHLASSVDAMPPFKYPILKNVRSYKEGVIQPRPGQLVYNSIAIPDSILHSIDRMNSDLPTASQAFAFLIGAGSSLYTDNSLHTGLVLRASGFSGDPLSFCSFRPNNSPEPFDYIGDRTKMGKVKVDGTFRNMGIVPPSVPPTGPGTTVPSLNSFQSTTIDDGYFTAGGWVTDTPANMANTVNAGTAANDAATLLYDSGSTGWACVGVAAPLDSSAYDLGAIVILNEGGVNAEKVIIQNLFKPIKTTTVASIIYDNGVGPGLCTIQPTASKHKAWEADTMIKINTEFVRVLSVSFGQDDVPSIRCSTTSTHVAGESLSGLLNFRAFFNNVHTTGEIIFIRSIIFQMGVGTILGSLAPNTPTQVGTATKVAVLDLGNVGGRAIQDDDEVNLVVQINHGTSAAAPLPTIQEVQFQLDCGNGTFTNYFAIILRPSDLTPATDSGTTSTLAARQQAVTRSAADDTISPFETTQSITREKLQRRLARAQARGATNKVAKIQAKLAGLDGGTGGSGGSGGSGGEGGSTTSGGGTGSGTSIQVPPSSIDEFPIRVKVKDVTRVGADFGKGWADISKLRVRLLFSNPNSVAVAPKVRLSSWWIGGAFGPDAGDRGTPYTYRFRYRSSESGAKSYWSPATRSGVIPRRQRVQLVGTPSPDAQADKMDWARFGGSILKWKLIGTAPNSTATFNDDFPDDTLTSPDLDIDITEGFQPFPIQGLPVTGTCSTSGTMVTVTAGSISTSMAPGTDVVINGIHCTLYAPPISTTRFEIVESIGTLVGVSLFIPAPTLMGQPLPSLWGPFGQGEQGSVMFACGDLSNPGRLYWTNPDDPDFSNYRNSLDVTSPSEPLMGGFMFDNKSFVFSTQDLYYIYPSQTILGRLTFKASRSGLGKGVVGRYSFCVYNGKVYFISPDGIYVTEGSIPQLITPDLTPLFPHEGQPGVTTNGYIPPDFTLPNFLRLAGGNGEIRFDYKATDSNFYSLTFKESGGAWLPDTYGRPVTCSYCEEGEEGKGTGRWFVGSTNGKLYTLSGSSDDGLSISCQVRHPSDSYGDDRSEKLWGDFLLDCNPNGANITAQPGFNNYATLTTPLTFSDGARIEPPTIIDINSGMGIYARNATLDVSWSSILTPELFFWEPSVIDKPEDSARRVTDFYNAGMEQAKWWQGLRIRFNTYGVAKSFKVQADNGVNGVFTDVPGATFTLTSNGESVQAVSFPIPYIAHLSRLLPTDSIPWSVIDVEWVTEPEPELVLLYEPQPSTYGMRGFWFSRDQYIAHVSTAPLSLVFIADGVTQPTLTIPSSGGIFKKDYVQLPALKQKVLQHILSSTQPFRLYRDACEVKIKSWGSSEAFRTINPFGDVHNTFGARV